MSFIGYKKPASWFLTAMAARTDHYYEDLDPNLDYSRYDRRLLSPAIPMLQRHVEISKGVDAVHSPAPVVDTDDDFDSALDQESMGHRVKFKTEIIAYETHCAVVVDEQSDVGVMCLDRVSTTRTEGARQCAAESTTVTDLVSELCVATAAVDILLKNSTPDLATILAKAGYADTKRVTESVLSGSLTTLPDPTGFWEFTPGDVKNLLQCKGASVCRSDSLGACLTRHTGLSALVYFKEWGELSVWNGVAWFPPRATELSGRPAAMGVISCLEALGASQRWLFVNEPPDKYCLCDTAVVAKCDAHFTGPNHDLVNCPSVYGDTVDVVFADTCAESDRHSFVTPSPMDRMVATYLALALNRLATKGSVTFRVCHLVSSNLVAILGLCVKYFTRLDVLKPDQFNWWQGDCYVSFVGRNMRDKGRAELVTTLLHFANASGDLVAPGSVRAYHLVAMCLYRQLVRSKCALHYLCHVLKADHRSPLDYSGVEQWRRWGDELALAFCERYGPESTAKLRQFIMTYCPLSSRVQFTVNDFLMSRGHQLTGRAFPPIGFIRNLARTLDRTHSAKAKYQFAINAFDYRYNLVDGLLYLSCRGKVPTCLRVFEGAIDVSSVMGGVRQFFYAYFYVCARVDWRISSFHYIDCSGC